MKYLNQYHKERSQKAMQFVEQSKPVTHEQAVEQERRNRIGWLRSESLRELSERARLTGVWIEDVTPLTDDKGTLSKGTEKIVCLSKDDKTGNWLRRIIYEDDVPSRIMERAIDYYPFSFK